MARKFCINGKMQSAIAFHDLPEVGIVEFECGTIMTMDHFLDVFDIDPEFLSTLPTVYYDQHENVIYDEFDHPSFSFGSPV